MGPWSAYELAALALVRCPPAMSNKVIWFSAFAEPHPVLFWAPILQFTVLPQFIRLCLVPPWEMAWWDMAKRNTQHRILQTNSSMEASTRVGLSISQACDIQSCQVIFPLLQWSLTTQSPLPSKHESILKYGSRHGRVIKWKGFLFTDPFTELRKFTLFSLPSCWVGALRINGEESGPEEFSLQPCQYHRCPSCCPEVGWELLSSSWSQAVGGARSQARACMSPEYCPLPPAPISKLELVRSGRPLLSASKQDDLSFPAH